MDQNKISRIINETLKDFEHKSCDVFFEENDVLRIVVISNSFLGVRLLKRISTLSSLFEKLSANELFDYHLIFNPLTVNEKELGVSETEIGSTADDLSGQKIAKHNHPTH